MKPPAILLDQNAPVGLRRILAAYEVRTAAQMGWDALSNGDLLSAAEAAGFAVMITADRNTRYQQNLTGRRIAIIELTTTHWPTIRFNAAGIVAMAEAAKPGSFSTAALPRPLLRRRPFSGNWRSLLGSKGRQTLAGSSGAD